MLRHSLRQPTKARGESNETGGTIFRPSQHRLLGPSQITGSRQDKGLLEGLNHEAAKVPALRESIDKALYWYFESFRQRGTT
jgi:hypothetical protein